METVGVVLLIFFLIIGVAVIFFGIAGTFVIVAAALIYGLLTHFESLSPSFLLLLLGMTLAVEAIEELATALLARRFGGSKWAMLGALVGSFSGAVIGTPVAPVLGTLIGGFAGAFAGACVLEWMHTSDLRRGLRVGTGALLGAMGGKMTKITVAVIMAILVAVRVF